MRHWTWMALFGLAACGGPGAGGGPSVNAFTGTVSVTSALPAGTTTCAAVQTVTFTAGGASVHTVSIPGGGCVAFVNNDAADHQPATRASNPCPALDAPGPLHAGATFTTAPLGASAGAQTCDWQDLLNPPGSGGGGY